ncbi:hypothetical protein Tco_1431434 [Tanacetum coccineum]
MESSDQFICFFCGSLSDEYVCPCSTCELCGNDAHYGYDCPSQVPFVYNQDPCFNQTLVTRFTTLVTNRLVILTKFSTNFTKLLLQLSTDLQTLGNTLNQLKQKEQDSSQYWKPPVYYSDDDDNFYRESIDETPPSDAITPDLPITDSLVIEDEHLDTISETDSDEEIKSSVNVKAKNLNKCKITKIPLMQENFIKA